MASSINAGDAKRGDMWLVDPFEMDVQENLRGRHKPPTEEQVIERALSMMKHGQLQPVEGRKLANKRIQIIMGFTRTNAARLIRKGFTDAEGVHHCDPKFMLKLVVVTANDREAFTYNIVENAHRNYTSDVDDAHNHRILSERYGMTDAEITALYQYKDKGRVGRLRKLLLLPEEVQDQVHDGRMTVTAALDLLELPSDKQAEVIKAATKDTGKVDTGKVRSQVRDHILADQEPKDSGAEILPPAGPPRSKARSMGELRAFLKEEPCGKTQTEFATAMLEWLDGNTTNKQFAEAFDKATKAFSKS